MPRRGRRPVEARSIFYTILRRRNLMALCLAGAILPVVYLNSTLPPVYQTSTTILVESTSETSSPLDLLATPVTKSALVNQIQEIKSMALARDVAGTLPRETKKTLLRRYRGEDNDAAQNQWLAKYISQNISADVVRESDVIAIRVRANDPIASVSVATTLTDVVENRNLFVRREEISVVKKF
ncbi:MAG: hypothetical protein V2A71_07220, partial [Candidatus Eisenbacteria bacterium]